MRLIADRAGILTYAIDYQLAPEAKFPVQIDEIEYFVRWLFDNADAQGVDANKIAVGGDSAGGNMTCVIALKLRDENGPELALQVPLFPEAAFPGDTLSGSENRTGLYLETNGIYEMVRNYIKNSDDGRHPYITVSLPNRMPTCRRRSWSRTDSTRSGTWDTHTRRNLRRPGTISPTCTILT